MSLGVWIAAFLTLATFSIVFDENPFYRIAEHLYVGVSAGHAITMGWQNIRDLSWNPMVNKGDMVAFVPFLLGLLLYTRFLRGDMRWLNRIPASLLVGVGTGLAIGRTIQTDLLGQISATMIPLNNLDNIVILFGTIGAICYFFFSFKQGGPIKLGAQVGRWVMMVAFGSAFSNTVMGRLSLFIGRVQFLLGDWLGVLR